MAATEPDRYIEFPELSMEQILSQMVADPGERAAIFGNLGTAGTFPSRRCTTLTTARASFLSFFLGRASTLSCAADDND
jgi:hypothetical protein